jgi:hypothetical protein
MHVFIMMYAPVWVSVFVQLSSNGRTGILSMVISWDVAQGPGVCFLWTWRPFGPCTQDFFFFLPERVQQAARKRREKERKRNKNKTKQAKKKREGRVSEKGPNRLSGKKDWAVFWGVPGLNMTEANWSGLFTNHGAELET